MRNNPGVPEWEYAIKNGTSSVDEFDTRHNSKSGALSKARQVVKERRERWHKAYGDNGDFYIVEYQYGKRTGKVYRVR